MVRKDQYQVSIHNISSGLRQRTETLRRSCCTQTTSHRIERETFGARRKAVGTCKGGRKDYIAGLQLCLFIFLGSSWLTPQPAEGLVSPPHLRVCPGPLDNGNSIVCSIPGTVTFARAIQEVRLSANQTVIRVSRVGGFLGQGVVSYETVNNTARAGIEFVATQGELSWSTRDGQDKGIVVYLINSGEYRAGSFFTSFNIRIFEPIGFGLGSIVETEVRILNTNAVTGRLSLPEETIVVNEQSRIVSVNVTRTRGTDCNSTVQYRTRAIPGSDYGHYGLNTASQTGTLEWNEGDASPRRITIPIRDNSQLQNAPGEEFYIELYDSSCSTIGNRRVRVIVTDDDQVGVLRVVTPRVSVSSDAGFAVVTISRVNGAATPVSLAFFTSAGTAVEGTDFAATSGLLIWQHAESGDKTISIPVYDVGLGLPDKSFTLRLAYLTGIEVESGKKNVEVTIVTPQLAVPELSRRRNLLTLNHHGDGGELITVEADRALVNESDGIATFTIRRPGSALGSASATWQTEDGDAVAGIDYVKDAGTVSWADGDQSARTVTIDLIEDGSSRLGLQFKHFFVSLTLLTLDTFLDPVEKTAAVFVADDGARTGFLLFPQLEFDPFTSTLSPEIARYTVDESVGQVQLVVMRKDGFEGNVSIQYRTVDGTAADGTHYTAASGRLSWVEGDFSNRSISISITDDDIFSPSVPSKFFRVQVFGFELSGHGFSTRSYSGPSRAEAEVEIVDDDGGGVLGFVLETLQVSESAGTVSLDVSRKGSTNTAVSVTYSTVAGTAAAPLAASSFPASCDGATVSGTRLVAGAGGVVREVYCLVDGVTGHASASLLRWDQSTTLWDRECAILPGAADSPSSLLWTDLAARVSTAQASTTDAAAFASVQVGPTVGSAEALGSRPSGVGDRARPVPFPHNKKTVWFDWQNQALVWADGTVVEANVAFSLLGINGVGGMDDSSNDFYFITDGISAVHVGARTQLATGNSAVLISFDWESASYSSRAVNGLTLPDDAWCSSSDDAFGHMLWTVNGRVLYRDCTALAGEGDALRVVLGGPIEDPMAKAEEFVMERCPEELFGDCGAWVLAGGRKTTGLDLFSHVDAAGHVYFGDRGSDGGLFGCGSGDHYGSVRTGIQLGREAANDYVPVTSTLTWAAGDSTSKTILLDIVADGVVDAAVLESFTVQLSSPLGAAISPDRGGIEVVIEDMDGPGKVEAVVGVSQSSPVLERGFCCSNCGEAFALSEQLWCSDFEVRRTGSRGAVCVDYALVGAGGEEKLTAQEGVHFVRQSGTLCWDSGDASTQTVTAQLPYHQPYDMMHKTFALRLTARPGLEGGTYDANSGIQIGKDAVQTIEDEDMTVGFFTFKASELTGTSVFAYNDQEPSALLLVERMGGTDLDVDITVETALLPFGTNALAPDTRIPVQVPVAVEDGSSGNCDDGACASIVTVQASPALAGATIFDPNAEYLSVSQRLRWKHGDSGVRGLTIPLLYGAGSVAQNVPATHRFFAVQITSARASSRGARLTSSAPVEDILPPANPVSDCDAATCTLQGNDVTISRCNSLACRNSASSEALVAIPSLSGSGTIRLVKTTYEVSGSIPKSSVLFPVMRFGGATGAVSIQYRAAPIAVRNVSVPAIAMAEFTDVSGILQWSDGDRRDQVISVPIMNDVAYVRGRIRKSFAVELFDPQGGATLAAEAREAIVIIVDDDASPGVMIAPQGPMGSVVRETS